MIGGEDGPGGGGGGGGRVVVQEWGDVLQQPVVEEEDSLTSSLTHSQEALIPSGAILRKAKKGKVVQMCPRTYFNSGEEEK